LGSVEDTVSAAGHALVETVGAPPGAPGGEAVLEGGLAECGLPGGSISSSKGESILEGDASSTI
jgi:hypothetical protein